MLHELLFTVERLDNVVKAHEVIDLNHYKIISRPSQIKSIFRQYRQKPFVFFNNKN